MKTKVLRVKVIKFTDNELSILKELGVKDIEKEWCLNDKLSQSFIDLLIELNPENVIHKDFIMGFIKELKK
jgi:hypothetical protein